MHWVQTYLCLKVDHDDEETSVPAVYPSYSWLAESVVMDVMFIIRSQKVNTYTDKSQQITNQITRKRSHFRAFESQELNLLNT